VTRCAEGRYGKGKDEENGTAGVVGRLFRMIGTE